MTRKWFLVLALLPVVCFATDKPVRPPPHPHSDGLQEVTVTASPIATSMADAVSTASSAATGGDANAVGGSVSLASQFDTVFRALALEFPGLDAGNCIGGAQGGGDNGQNGAFLGVNFIIDPCYFQKLAAEASNVDTYARLKCADTKYRNAVAYHIPWSQRRKRRDYCVQRATNDEHDRLGAIEARYVTEIAALSERLAECQASGERRHDALVQCLSGPK